MSPDKKTAGVLLFHPWVSAFSTSGQVRGKKSKKSKSAKNARNDDDGDGESSSYSSSNGGGDEQDGDDTVSHSNHPKPDPSTPTEFPDVEGRLARAGDRFGDLMRKLRSGQMPMAIEEVSSVRVRPDKSSPATYPLHELAVVVPRPGASRSAISILVHEADYIKPIMSAVQSHPRFNQQPQRSADNDLELTMKVARESPQDMQRRVRDAAHAYREAVRLARQRREKVHARWVKEKEWVPDVKFKADKELQKKVDKKNAEIDRLEAQVLKTIATLRDD